MKREVRKPLIVFTPKSLLRAKSARSPIDELVSGSFQEVLDDAGGRATRARSSASSSAPARSATTSSPGATTEGLPVAVLRLEQLYPFPKKQFAELLAKYPNATQVVWLQEEPDNMGPRSFVSERLWPLVPSKMDYREVSPGRLGQPGHRQPHHPRAGAGRHPEPDARGPRLT